MRPEYIVIGAVFCVLGFYAVVLNQNRVQIPRIVEKWAADNKFVVVSWEYRNFFSGPFFLSNSGTREICYVLIQDNVGLRRSAWLRCGGGLPWPPSSTIEVRWDS
jgi:hypothetical protein